MIKIRRNLVNRRKSLKLTQKDIAKKIGRSRSTYASYETGAISPSLEIGIMLKEILKTEDDNIFLNENVMNNDDK